MGQPQGGFDMNRMSTGQKILLASGVLYLISMFFPWIGADLGDFGDILGGLDVPDVTANGFAGIGMISGILVIALLVWEGLVAAGVNINMGTASPALIGAILGGATGIFGLINFLSSMDGLRIGAWLGLIFSLALLYGAYVRFQESKVSAPPPVA